MRTLYRTTPFDQLFRIRVPKPATEENIERGRANEKFLDVRAQAKANHGPY